MSFWVAVKDGESPYKDLVANHPRDFGIQLVLSTVLGASAFLAFCVWLFISLPVYC